MRLSLRRVGLGLVGFSTGVVAVLAACDDSPSIGGGPVLDLDTGVAVIVPPAPADAASDAETDAGEDAGPPDDMAALEGIWHGVGLQQGSSWTILVDLHGGPKGGMVGVMTYPSLACGGTLVRLEDADGGADAGPLDAGPLDTDGGDGGALPSIVLREVVNDGPCVPVGDDSFTLLPNGNLFFAWRAIGGDVVATGTLTRVAPRKSTTTTPTGIWANGAPNGSYTWPFLGTISRLDDAGSAAGVFLRSLDAQHACGGLWTRAADGGTTLRFDELFADSNILCGAPQHATITTLADGGLGLAATTGTGADAGSFTLDRH